MIQLTLTVDSPSVVTQIYDRIRVYSGISSSGPFGAITNLVPSEIILLPSTSSYSAIDYDGTETTWYVSQYYSSTTSGLESSWSDPVLGESGEIFYNPLYPPEVAYGTEDKLVINRIRLLIGDPVNIAREYGYETESSIHPDNRTYELDEKGWPATITYAGTNYNSLTNPIVNGYRYLSFANTIAPEVTISGITYGFDVWYYTFRHSDREIVEAYDNCPVPAGLTVDTTTPEIYALATSIDLLMGEFWLDATEDGTYVKDGNTHYNPEPGLSARQALLDKLRKRLDDLINANRLYHGGWRLD